MNGYNNGFNNGSNWGYFNSYDVNSGYSKMEYGPRGSNGGGNSNRQTTAGMLIPEGDNARTQFIKAVNIKQESTPKFTDVPNRSVRNSSSTENYSGANIPLEPVRTRNYSQNENTSNNSNNSNTTPPATQQGFWPRINNNQNSNSNSNSNGDNTINTNNPVRGGNSNSEKIRNSSIENSNIINSGNSERSNNSGNSNNSDSQNNGSSTPRGGGGSNKPR